MSDLYVFDALVEAVEFAGAEGGTWSFQCVDGKKDGAVEAVAIYETFDGGGKSVYIIPSKELFIDRLREVLSVRGGEGINLNGEIDVHFTDVHELFWEVLERYEVAYFDY